MNPFETFLTLFERLKDEAGGDPERMVVFYRQKSQLKSAADELARYVTWGDFQRRVLHSNKKWHAGVPDEFLLSWDDFELNWWQRLLDVWLPIDFSSLGISHESRYSGRAASPRLAGPLVSDAGEEPEDWESTFDPVHHDGGAALQGAFVAAAALADDLGTDRETGLSRAANIGLEAYDYLRGTIGFSADDAFARWREVPVIYVPAHVSRTHEWNDVGSLYQLLDDAVRAYVFGAPAAAIAMCRAVLEMVLKDHYAIVDKRSADPRGADPSLGELIILADAKYEFIQGARLRKLNSQANTILHSFRSRAPLSDLDEQVIIEFMKTLKFLIQRAPSA